MATTQQIRDAILLGRSYRFEIVDNLLTELKKGCCGNTTLIAQISGLISSLNHRIDDNLYNDTTNALYSCLLSSIADYSGASLSVDPNASLPNTIIEGGGGSGDSRPDPLLITWNDLVDTGTAERYEYNNTLWAGFIAFLEVDNAPWLTEGVDVNNKSTGGFTLVTPIYYGQQIRAVNYASTNPPSNPLTPLFIDWS